MDERFSTKAQDLQEQLLSLFREGSEEEARAFMDHFNLLMTYYRCAMMEIETKFRVLEEEFSLQHDRNPISGIHTRLKSPQSIREKLIRRGFPVTLDSVEENLTDIAGVRVICAFREDVYYLERALLAQDDVTLIQRKDYIRSPKENGYRSLHLIISTPIFLSEGKRMMKVEVQFRTIAMDSWASLEHQLRYKKGKEISDGVAGELRACAELSDDLDQRMDRLRQILLDSEE